VLQWGSLVSNKAGLIEQIAILLFSTLLPSGDDKHLEIQKFTEWRNPAAGKTISITSNLLSGVIASRQRFRISTIADCAGRRTVFDQPLRGFPNFEHRPGS
jgi:hypothetical protein